MERESSQFNETARENHSKTISSSLNSFRKKIRIYVFWQGFFYALIWLAISFWLAFLLDYLPVLFGLSELSQEWRAILLVGIAIVFGLIVYRWIVQRVRRPLDQESLALLLERRFPQLKAGLVEHEMPSHNSGSFGCCRTFVRRFNQRPG